MSDSVRPHRWQPTRLHHPWDSPGKNTGVGCHFLLQCMKMKSQSEVAQLSPTLSYPMDCSPPGSSIHGIFQARVLEWGAIAFSKTTLILHNWVYDCLLIFIVVQLIGWNRITCRAIITWKEKNIISLGEVNYNLHTSTKNKTSFKLHQGLYLMSPEW